jgi:hypothetical protein
MFRSPDVLGGSIIRWGVGEGGGLKSRLKKNTK